MPPDKFIYLMLIIIILFLILTNNNLNFDMNLGQLCTPALLYLIFSIVQIVIDIFKNLYNTAFLKFIVTAIFTTLLNVLCSRGLGIISWIVVFIPFIFMTVITSILLFVFGLDPSTGKLSYTVDNTSLQSSSPPMPPPRPPPPPQPLPPTPITSSDISFSSATPIDTQDQNMGKKARPASPSNFNSSQSSTQGPPPSNVNNQVRTTPASSSYVAPIDTQDQNMGKKARPALPTNFNSSQSSTQGPPPSNVNNQVRTTPASSSYVAPIDTQDQNMGKKARPALPTNYNDEETRLSTSASNVVNNQEEIRSSTTASNVANNHEEARSLRMLSNVVNNHERTRSSRRTSNIVNNHEETESSSSMSSVADNDFIQTNSNIYKKYAPGCVKGYNKDNYLYNTTVESCAAHCDGIDGCKSFEYGVSYGGAFRSSYDGDSNYDPGTCRPQSAHYSADESCSGSYYNLDLYDNVTSTVTADVNETVQATTTTGAAAEEDEDATTPTISGDEQEYAMYDAHGCQGNTIDELDGDLYDAEACGGLCNDYPTCTAFVLDSTNNTCKLKNSCNLTSRDGKTTYIKQ